MYPPEIKDFIMDEDERKKLEDQGVVFYYNREERLKRMPENAKLYNGELKRKRGLFRVLLDSPGGKYILFVIVILIGIITALSLLDKPDENIAGGITASIKAFVFEDKVYVNLKFDKNEDILNAAVSAEINSVNTDEKITDTKTLTGEYKGEELILRTTFSDFEIKKVTAKILINGEDSTLSVPVER